MELLMLKIPLLSLLDLGVLASLIVISVCLILLTLTLRSIWTVLLTPKKEPKGGGGEPPKIWIDGPTDPFEAVVAKERAFLEKHVNRKGGTYRTVTFTDAILQAYRVQDELIEARQERATKAAKSAISQSHSLDDCILESLDEEKMNMNLAEYEAYVGSILGAHAIGSVCLCPDGVNYCNWGSSMFEEFIVDTTLWDLVSIKIYDTNDNLLSTSSINNMASSPSGRFVLVTMSDQVTLTNLSPGTMVKIVFKWLENTIEKCILMENVIPSDLQTPTPPAAE